MYKYICIWRFKGKDAVLKCSRHWSNEIHMGERWHCPNRCTHRMVWFNYVCWVHSHLNMVVFLLWNSLFRGNHYKLGGGGGGYISVNGRICSFIDSCLSTTIHICCFCIFTKYTIPLYYIFLLCLIFLNITPHWYLMIGLLHWYHLGNSTSHTYRCVEALH